MYIFGKGSEAMKILMTGFEPFGLHKLNPSWEAVNALPDRIEGAEIIKLRFPLEDLRLLSRRQCAENVLTA